LKQIDNLKQTFNTKFIYDVSKYQELEEFLMLDSGFPYEIEINGEFRVEIDLSSLLNKILEVRYGYQKNEVSWIREAEKNRILVKNRIFAKKIEFCSKIEFWSKNRILAQTMNLFNLYCNLTKNFFATFVKSIWQCYLRGD
jgi:hypothetical protein